MSRRREVESRLDSLAEIQEILGAMRSLAFTENRRIANFLETQRRAFAGMETALADLLGWYPPGALGPARRLLLVIGSERGFCGDFNESLQRELAQQGEETEMVIIGQRLSGHLDEDPRILVRFDGPSAVDEVETVLLRLSAWLGDYLGADDQPRPLRLSVLHHGMREGVPGVSVFEPFDTAGEEGRYSHPPRLNVALPVLLAQLSDHYLFAALHVVFYESLAAENRQRLQHVDYALRRIEDTVGALRLRRNHLRQEEITNEIEMIMLGLESGVPV